VQNAGTKGLIIGWLKQDQAMKQKLNFMNVVNAVKGGGNIVNMDPAREVMINCISQMNTRVAISGIVIIANENSFVIDDGSGQAHVFFTASEFKQGLYLRVIGLVTDLENFVKIQADIVQDLSSVDKLLHRRLKQILG